MQKDRIYYMWLCYYMWRDCKINYFFCQQGWRPIVKIQLQISMNYSTKQCFIAKIAKSSYWYCKDALHCQRDILTFICLCHCFLAKHVPFEDQRCSALPESHNLKAAAGSHPAAQHHQGKPGRKIPSPCEKHQRSVLKHIGCVALGSLHLCFCVVPSPWTNTGPQVEILPIKQLL